MCYLSFHIFVFTQLIFSCVSLNTTFLQALLILKIDYTPFTLHSCSSLYFTISHFKYLFTVCTHQKTESSMKTETLSALFIFITSGISE